MFPFKKKKEAKAFEAFATGTLLPLEQVPDPVFSQKMMGEGFAIDVVEPTIVAPLDGEISLVFPTGHAYGLTTKEGFEILIHIGIDTVELKGEGFNNKVEVGQKVSAGDVLTELDLDFIRNAGKSLITPCIFTSGQKVTLLNADATVSRGDTGIIEFE